MTGYLQLPAGRRVAVQNGLIMGRDPKCEVVLEDRKASRHHAKLVVQGSVVEIEDLESRNGTLLNGKPVRRRLLRDGDEIRIGLTSLTFVEQDLPAEPNPAPAAAPERAADPPLSDPVEELLAEDPYRPGGGLEGDPLAAAPKPQPAPVERPSEPAAAADDVEILEFVDEVVEVKRRPPATEPRVSSPPAGAGAGRPATPATREHGVLQFSKHAADGGLLKDDMAQMPALQRIALVVVCLAVAGGLGYLVMVLVSG